jgi:hypothetical protein
MCVFGTRMVLFGLWRVILSINVYCLVVGLFFAALLDSSELVQ